MIRQSLRRKADFPPDLTATMTPLSISHPAYKKCRRAIRFYSIKSRPYVLRSRLSLSAPATCACASSKIHIPRRKFRTRPVRNARLLSPGWKSAHETRSVLAVSTFRQTFTLGFPCVCGFLVSRCFIEET